MIYTITISLLIEKLFYLLRPQSFSFQIASEFIDTLCPKGEAFDSLCFPEGRVFVHNDCPVRRVFAPFKSCPRGLSGGGGGLDEIDTCISHRHGKSDMAAVDQVIHASLKCVEFFQLQSSYGSKRF